MEARFTKKMLIELMGPGTRIFLDSDDLSDLKLLMQHVRDAEVLTLFQTEDVLMRP